MHVISLVRHAARFGGFPSESSDEVWRHYWSQGGELTIEVPSGPNMTRRKETAGVLWEYLIEGQLQLVDQRH